MPFDYFIRVYLVWMTILLGYINRFYFQQKLVFYHLSEHIYIVMAHRYLDNQGSTVLTLVIH